MTLAAIEPGRRPTPIHEHGLLSASSPDGRRAISPRMEGNGILPPAWTKPPIGFCRRCKLRAVVATSPDAEPPSQSAPRSQTTRMELSVIKGEVGNTAPPSRPHSVSAARAQLKLPAPRIQRPAQPGERPGQGLVRPPTWVFLVRPRRNQSATSLAPRPAHDSSTSGAAL